MKLLDLYNILDKDTTIALIDNDLLNYIWIGKPDNIPFNLIECKVDHIKGIRIYLEV